MDPKKYVARVQLGDLPPINVSEFLLQSNSPTTTIYKGTKFLVRIECFTAFQTFPLYVYITNEINQVAGACGLDVSPLFVDAYRNSGNSEFKSETNQLYLQIQNRWDQNVGSLQLDFSVRHFTRNLDLIYCLEDVEIQHQTEELVEETPLIVEDQRTRTVTTMTQKKKKLPRVNPRVSDLLLLNRRYHNTRRDLEQEVRELEDRVRQLQKEEERQKAKKMQKKRREVTDPYQRVDGSSIYQPSSEEDSLSTFSQSYQSSMGGVQELTHAPAKKKTHKADPRKAISKTSPAPSKSRPKAADQSRRLRPSNTNPKPIEDSRRPPSRSSRSSKTSHHSIIDIGQNENPPQPAENKSAEIIDIPSSSSSKRHSSVIQIDDFSSTHSKQADPKPSAMEIIEDFETSSSKKEPSLVIDGFSSASSKKVIKPPSPINTDIIEDFASTTSSVKPEDLPAKSPDSPPSSRPVEIQDIDAAFTESDSLSLGLTSTVKSSTISGMVVADAPSKKEADPLEDTMSGLSDVLSSPRKSDPQSGISQIDQLVDLTSSGINEEESIHTLPREVDSRPQFKQDDDISLSSSLKRQLDDTDSDITDISIGDILTDSD